jgi:hypothetical protein
MYQNQSTNLQVKQVIGLQSTKKKCLEGVYNLQLFWSFSLQSTTEFLAKSTIKPIGWLVKSEGLRVLDPNFAQNIHQTEINFGWIYNLKWRDILSTDLNKIGEEEKYLQVYTFFYLYSTSFPVQNYHLEFKCFNHL